MINKILIADDEKNMIWALKKALSKEGYEIIIAENGEQAANKTKQEEPDLILLDLKMPKMNGIEALKEIKEHDKNIPVIMLTAHGTTKSAVEAMKIGATDYISKPFDIDELLIIINKALEHKKISDELNYIKTEINNKKSKIIYKSDEMNKIINTISKVAPTDATILILGESGTGKELVADEIYENSNRKNKPFIKINCGAIPENLLESELFGYEKGAFTGANAKKPGKFDRANEGTVFLDEVGEISQAMQVKLLRVLQEKEFERIGGNKTIKVDIRVIAATNSNLKKMVSEGKFREDLYYRLNVIPIKIAPLRDRKEDIEILAQYFVKKYSKQLNSVSKRISDDGIEKLTNYEWPGNIRELQNVIERSVILSIGNVIDEEDLPDDICNYKIKNNHKVILPKDGISLDQLEKDLIIQALEKSNQNQTKAAKLLKISRHTLLYRMEKYNLKK